MPRFIASNVEKKTDYEWLHVINKYIAKVRVENPHKFCCTRFKFPHFPTSVRIVTIYVSKQPFMYIFEKVA